MLVSPSQKQRDASISPRHGRVSAVQTNSLTTKFALGTAGGLATISIVLLILVMVTYRAQHEHERGQASVELNRLLRASLENAMLKRDLPGLQDIVDRLGQQDGIAGVMVLNRQNEVRFASDPAFLGQRLFSDSAPASENEVSTTFVVNEQGREVMRSVNAVQNRPPCEGCHGRVTQNPINGVLIVDYDAEPIQESARWSTLMLMGSGSGVVLIAVGGGWWFLRKYVLKPVWRLASASHSLAEGDLSARVNLNGTDELAALGCSFDKMAAALEQSSSALRERETFLQALLDADPDGIRVIDEDYTVVNANRTYRQQLGLRAGQETGVSCFTASHGRSSPCPASETTCPVGELHSNNMPLKVIQRHCRSDGSEHWAEVFAAPMEVEVNGKRHAYVVESIRNLEEAVQLSHTQKLSELGTLAAGVAHGIHNPLASVRIALQGALRDMKQGNSPDKIADYLKLVDEQVDRCVDMTQRLLKLGAHPTETPGLVCVNSAVDETLSLLRYESEQRGIELHLDFCATAPRIIAVDSDIRLLALNFIQNAFHAMPEGGKLTIATRDDEQGISISFQDTGIGIAPDAMPHIFDPFFSKRADGVAGTGLGLSIAKSIVERYQGHINVHSPPGEGVRIITVFPRP